MEYHMFENIRGMSKRTRGCLKSRASRLFTQPFVQAKIKENIKTSSNWPWCGEFTDDRWIPRTKSSYTENTSIWWRHNEHASNERIWQCYRIPETITCVEHTTDIKTKDIFTIEMVGLLFCMFLACCESEEDRVQRLSPGARPTNGISIGFEIRPKYAVLWFKMFSTDHNEILHTPRRCNCRDVCIISLWSVQCILN